MSKLEISRKENIFGDNLAYASRLNFSRGNLNNKNRLEVITTVASICYANPKAVGSESLYNRLASESTGLPSSAFEFVPVLLEPKEVYTVCENLGIEYFTNDLLIQGAMPTVDVNIIKFGQWITHNDKKYLLTNFRAIVYDYEVSLANSLVTGKEVLDLRDRFNTEEECDIIESYYTVFKFYVDFPTRSQMVRHRVNLQEISRRFVSVARVGMNHYVSEKLGKVVSKFAINELKEVTGNDTEFGTDLMNSIPGFLSEQKEISLTTQLIIDMCMNHYFKAIEDGVKPQEARRIIPQTGYTEFYMGFLPFQLENFLRLRADTHSQWEVQQAAYAVKELLGR